MSTRRLDAADLPGALEQAQAALAADAPGSRHTWELPPGEHRLPLGLRLGAEGRTLVLSGPDTRLVFTGGDATEALSLTGERLVLDGLTLSAERDGDLLALRLSAERQVHARGLRLHGLRGHGVRGLLADAPLVDLDDVAVEGLAATGSADAVEVQAGDSARVRSVRLLDLRGHALTGISLRGADTTAEGISLTGLGATGTAIGLRAAAMTRVRLGDITLDGLRGQRVRGLEIDAPAGELSGLRSDRLEAVERVDPIWLAAETHCSIAGVALVRRFQPDGLEAQLQQAADELAEAITGSEHTWLIPAGVYDFDHGWALGRADLSLLIRAPQGGAETAQWRFGHDAALPGDLDALHLVGRRLGLDGLGLEARCTGQLRALRLEAGDEATADDLRLGTLRGTSVTAIAVEAPRVGLTDLGVTDTRATGGTATGVTARGDELMLQGLVVATLTATDAAIGIAADAEDRCSAYSLHTETIRGSDAEGIRLLLRAADARLMLLDLDARGVTAQADDGECIGIQAMTPGAIELRGASAGSIDGARASGALLAVGDGLDWLAGRIEDLRGRSAGTCGVRVLAGESTAAIAIADLHVEAVRGTPVADQARPDPGWGRWWRETLAEGVLPQTLPAPDILTAPDCAGLHLDAYVAETLQWTDIDPGALSIRDCVLRRISGTAIQVDGGVRDLALRRTEAWTALRGGWLDGERLILSNLTWHRHALGLTLGPAAVTIGNSLVTAIGSGDGIVLDPDTGIEQVASVHVSGAIELFDPAPDPLPYLRPGPAQVPASMHDGALAPNVAVDLRLTSDHGLEAAPIPDDDTAASPFVGAHEPDQPVPCELRDPQPPVPPEPVPAPCPSPVVDYRARDARGLLAVMLDRARVAMPQWQARNAADQLTMLMELLAHELDHLAYRQEVAVSEGTLPSALSRRSVEDHARLVDYLPDPGLSATTMVRFDIDAAGARTLEIDPAASLVIPADTLLVNPDATDTSVIFATEDALRYDPALRDLTLAEPIAPGAVSALLAGDLIVQGHGIDTDRPRIETGRWLVLVPPDPDGPRHVVRVTRVVLGLDSTRVYWDPRRPSPAEYPVDGTHCHGNVVPAHHGVPLTPLGEHLLPGALHETIESLRPWREQMQRSVDNRDGNLREVELPLDPVSVQARGWPLPAETRRAGIPSLTVWVDDEQWSRVDQLALCTGDDECYALRPGQGGGAAIRFGDGANAAALPVREVTIALSMRIGLGRQGNVGVGALTRLLGFGAGGDIASLLPRRADRDQVIRDHLRVTNVVAGTGGRDPEPIEHIRYQAPRAVREGLSAVALSDFPALLEQMPEVAAARAVFIDAGIRRIVRVTALLADEDDLARAEPGSPLAAERLRRWALVRHRLETIRLLGLDVELLPPVFVPLDLDILVDAEPWASSEQVRLAVEEALAGDGGIFDPDQRGLGRDVQVDRLHQGVLAVEGVAAARIRRLRRLRQGALECARRGRLPVGPDEVAVLRHPYGAEPDGLVTVEVCGGIA